VPLYNKTRSGNQTIYFVIGADVLVANGKCGISKETEFAGLSKETAFAGLSKETAFAGSIRGKGRAWWYYDVYIDSCCKAPTPVFY
jgi:hypothetical protein